MSNALEAFGTLMQVSTAGSAGSYQTIAEVGDITGPSLKAQMEDVTNHSSAGGYEEKIPTTLSLGQIKFPINFIPTDASHSYSAGLVKKWNDKTLTYFNLVFPDTTNWEFTGYVEQIDFKAPVKGKLSADVTITPTGQPTLS